jgi:hypothetical protein
MNKTGKILLFSFVCVVIRIFLAISAYFISMEFDNFKIPLAALLISMGVGLIYNHLYGNPKGVAGSDRYWNGIVHGILYILASICLFYSPELTLGILLLDVIYGIVTVAVHYS